MQQYRINPGELMNVRCLLSCLNSTLSQRPLLVIFTVSDFEVKKNILQKLFELRKDIQFQSNQSREDRLNHRELVKQLKERTASGEKNLVIRNLEIVTKDDEDLLQTAVSQKGMILD